MGKRRGTAADVSALGEPDDELDQDYVRDAMSVFWDSNDLDDEQQTIVQAASMTFDRESGILWVDHFGLSANGLHHDANAQLESQEWQNFGILLRVIKVSWQFMVGDWAAMGERALGLTYDDIGAIVGVKGETVKTWASVCRNVEKLLRINALGISKHHAVMGLSHDQQAYWLQRAFDEKMSVSKLRALIAGGDPDALKPTPILRFNQKAESFERATYRLAKKANRQHRQQMIDRLRQLADQLEQIE